MQPNRIAELNSRCRHGLDRQARIVITANCLNTLAAGDDPEKRILAQIKVRLALQNWQPPANDDGEHDFGILVVDDTKLFFKIDYYDRDLEHGSEDPANPEVTTRVLTVMLPDDY